MATTDVDGGGAAMLLRGGGRTSYSSLSLASKPSLSSTDAATVAHLLSGYSWSRMGTAATVTYAYRADGTSPAEGTSGFQRFNAAQIAQTELALQAWADVANIHFTRVDDGAGYSNNAAILFGDYLTGGSGAAYTYLPGDRRADASSGDVWINVTPSYAAAPAPGNYGAHTLIHEIGHALGLSHPSDYDSADDTAPTYALSASYFEDSRQYTVMSYFDAAQTGAKMGYAAVPLIDDITAAQRLYGANQQTRTGDTIYGFHSNTGIAAFSADTSRADLAFAVWDAGGRDTFDFSGFTGDQKIDLREGNFSDVGGRAGNVAIAYGAVIENAYGNGGSGPQGSITGNAADNLLVAGLGQGYAWNGLYGGAGNDVLIGGTSQNIFDGGSGTNVILGSGYADGLTLPGQISDYRTYAGADGFYTIQGPSVTDIVRGIETVQVPFIAGFSSGPLDFQTFLRQTRADGPAPAGALMFGNDGGIADFTGDGSSDLLWRHASGAVSTWGVSGATLHQNSFYAAVDPSWAPAETFDYNGDGRSDILWRQSGGALSIWTAAAAGFTQNVYFDTSVGNDWQIAGTGDFDGDGKDDVLWRRDDGALSTWRSRGAGFDRNFFSHGPVGGDWQVAGIADMNGDYQADIVWRSRDGGVSVWLASGLGFTENRYNASAAPSWHIAGLADFDGDAKADILWRADGGAVSLWRSNVATYPDGVRYNFAQSSYNDFVGPDWQVAQVGDFNGDGRADVLWRNASGAISTWQWNGSGFDQDVAHDASVGNAWSIASHDFLI